MVLPLSFVSRMKNFCGNEYEQFSAVLQEEPPVSIRMNVRKIDFIPSREKVKWSESGYYLPERLHFTFDPFFHAGAYYVQEASSMFLEHIIHTYIDQPVCCLDLCAAPGGKSTHLLSVLPEQSLLVSNEVIKNRSHILSQNMTKWGYPESIVTNNDPEAIGQLIHLFDLIVADVPCSGEGMFRKDPDSVMEWSEANVELCASRQRRIIHDVWDALAPGGLLIYSTCTYNTQENEDNIAYFVEKFGAELLPIPSLPEWNIQGAVTGNCPVGRFFPHKTKGEGFFIAVLRKPEDKPVKDIIKSYSKKQNRRKDVVPSILKTLVNEPGVFEFELSSRGYMAFPKTYYSVYKYLQEKLHVISAGILIGEVKGKDIVPAHSLAMSISMAVDIYPVVELDWSEAVKYLKREPVILSREYPKGFLLVIYKDIPLGFIKNLGNRTNNLYPNEWRIRSGYLPEEPRTLL
ncbi:MAG: RsmB/NOP family class I SAM-dependent RNA methyltransferase [Tannerellaceae bacterium]|nr:RsmB/NOP family class I SAM-dependent RNA methyltransferase [Tannerellaceae bacterium]